MKRSDKIQYFEQSSKERGRLMRGVKRCNLIRKLLTKYGTEILTDLTALLERQHWNLSDIARKHGFTREYARQIFVQIFGVPYGPIRDKKIRLRMISEGRAPEIY